MPAWTKIPKPTSTNWSGIPKPSESSVLGFNGGQPIGLLLALTRTVRVSSVITGWTDITKPTSSVWTLITKPTT